MHESQILDVVDSLTLGQLSLNEKAIIVADIKSEISNTRLASNITSLVLEKVNDLSKGLYKESQALPKTFQDFSESEGKQKPFEITNQDEIEKFLDQMMSKEHKDEYFNDTWDFYHPTEPMFYPGETKHRSNYNVQY
jgi:hypothetical protein